jgi:hypothetical protein
MSTQAPSTPPVELDRLGEAYDVIGELADRRSEEDRGAAHLTTYIGTRKADNTPVLITVVTQPPGDEGNALSHVAADTNLLATLSHRALLPVFEGVWVGDAAFAVISQRPTSPSLEKTIAREQLPYARIAAILREVNAVIEWARDKGIVHRAVTANNVFVESNSDRTLVMFNAAALPANGTPGRASDAATIARLAKAMMGERDDIPQRLIAETDGILGVAKERGVTPDVQTYIALVAMADAVKRGEEHAAETAMALEKQRHECKTAIDTERAEHERVMAEQRKEMERQREEMEKQFAAQRKEMERQHEDHEKALAERVKEMERQQAEHEKLLAKQRHELEKQHEQRLREVEKQREEQEKLFAARTRQLEKQMEQQQKALAKERKQFEREVARQREELRRDMAAASVAGAASRTPRIPELSAPKHVDVEVPLVHPSFEPDEPLHPDDEELAPMEVAEAAAVPDDEIDEIDEIVDEPETEYEGRSVEREVAVPPVALPSDEDAPDAVANAAASDESGIDDMPDEITAIPISALNEINASDDDLDEVVLKEEDRSWSSDKVSEEERLAWANTASWVALSHPQKRPPLVSRKWAVPALGAMLAVVLAASATAIVRHRHATGPETLASRSDSSTVDSAAGTVAAPYGFFAMPSADSIAKLRADSAAGDSSAAADSVAAAEHAAAERSIRRREAARQDSIRAAQSPARVDSAGAEVAPTLPGAFQPAVTTAPDSAKSRPATTTPSRDSVAPKPDTIKAAPLVAPKPDSAAKRDTTNKG